MSEDPINPTPDDPLAAIAAAVTAAKPSLGTEKAPERPSLSRKPAKSGKAPEASPTASAAGLKPAVIRMPYGFEMRVDAATPGPDGLWFAPKVEGASPQWLSGPFQITSECRTPSSTDWSIALEFQDPDGVTQTHVVSRADLVVDGAEVRKALAKAGLRLAGTRGAKEKLNQFLTEVQIDQRARLTDRIGWIEDTAFALPGRTLGAREIRVEFERHARGGNFAEAGTLDEWRAWIDTLVGEHRLLIFVLGVSFSGPLLRLLGVETGGFHLCGQSSAGKSTALRVAASVWGSGEAKGFMHQWRQTANAIEGTAAAHNDTCLILDEAGQADPREIGTIIYTLANSVSKVRAKADGSIRERTTWLLSILSSGEVTLGRRIEDGGGRAMPGHGVRIVDLPVDPAHGIGIFDPSAGQDLAVLADAIRAASSLTYGTAGPAFVEYLIRNRATAIARARATMDAFVAQHVPGGAAGQVTRAAIRFAVALAAADLAIEAGIVPLSFAAVEAIAGEMFLGWLRARGGSGASEDRQAIEQVRNFLQLHQHARFPKVDAHESWRSQMTAGFISENGEYFLFNDAGFLEAIRGLELRNAVDALADAGFLVRGEGRRPKRVVKIRGHSTRVYCIKRSILAGDAGDGSPPDETGAANDTANASQEHDDDI